jgi:peptidoglycan/LPS O-acetylase OafA/YrhL
VIAASDPVRAEGQAPNLVPPPGNPRFPLFDALRAIAALLVFLGHTVLGVHFLATHRSLLIWAGLTAYQGVGIFFLISGFLLYRPFLVARRGGAPLRLVPYAKRRFLRIVPAYWAALTIFIAAGFVSGVTAHNWWIFYGFGQIYSSDTVRGGIGVAWTLAIEVTFYAALPLFAWLAGKLSRGAFSVAGDVLLLVALSAASLVIRADTSPVDVAQLSTLATNFLWFALGMGLAVLSVVLENRAAPGWFGGALGRAWPLVSWTVAGLLFVLLHAVAVGSIALSASVTDVVANALYGLVALFVLLPAAFGEAHGGAVRRLLRARPLAWIGLVSYGVYLYHTIVITQVEKLLPSGAGAGHYLAVALCSLALTLLCAAISYYVLERPVMLLGGGSRAASGPALGWRGRVKR